MRRVLRESRYFASSPRPTEIAMTPEWRLIREDAPGSGGWNMALDRAIQLQHAHGDTPPTLRLYTWERPTVTLGRFQRLEGVDTEACARLGVDVVRRFTGGRGVLHDDELTYSVVAGLSDGVPRGVAASYRFLCAPLRAAYEALGVPARLTSRPRGDAGSAACYLHATHADLSVGVAKLSGSAQVWSEETVLQHGSFTRTRDIARESELFRLSAEEGARLAASTTTLADTLADVPGTDRIAQAVIVAFEQELGIRLVPGPLSAAERSLAQAILDGGVVGIGT